MYLRFVHLTYMYVRAVLLRDTKKRQLGIHYQESVLKFYSGFSCSNQVYFSKRLFHLV